MRQESEAIDSLDDRARDIFFRGTCQCYECQPPERISTSGYVRDATRILHFFAFAENAPSLTKTEYELIPSYCMVPLGVQRAILTNKHQRRARHLTRICDIASYPTSWSLELFFQLRLAVVELVGIISIFKISSSDPSLIQSLKTTQPPPTLPPFLFLRCRTIHLPTNGSL